MEFDRTAATRRLSRLAGPLIPALLAAGAAWPGAPPAALAAAVLLALLAALAVAGHRLAGLALPAAGAASRASAAFVLATALAILPALALGHLGHLRPGPYLLVMSALAIGALLLPAAPPPVPPPARPGRGPRELRPVERGLAVAALCALAVATATEIRNSRYLPAGSFGVDDRSYHLTAVATWAERGDLAMVKFAVGDASTAYYPIAGELVAWVLLAPFEDSDVAARWAQLPFALATLTAMAALAGRLAIRPRSLLPALALYWSIPRVFPAFALAAGNDHATAFFLLAAADGAFELARRRTAGAGLYAGAALGLLLGTKYLGILFAPLVVGLFAIGRIADRRGEQRAGGWRPELVAAAAAAVCGGYTYLRNGVTVGNPIFPAPVSIAGIDLLPGWQAVTLAARRHLPEFAIDVPKILFRSSHWGSVVPWILVPAALLAPALALLLPRLSGTARRAAADPAPLAAEGLGRWSATAVLLLPVATFAVFLFLVHDHRDIRYFLGGVAAAAVAWAWLADRLERSAARGAGVLAGVLRCAVWAAVLVVAARPALWRPRYGWLLLPIAAAGALAAAHWGPVRRALGAVAARPATAVTLAALLLWLPIVQVAHQYPRRKLGRLPMTALLESLAPSGTTVAYVGLNAPYPLSGSRLQNRVVIVPTGGDPDARLYDWGGDAEQPFRDPTASGAWIGNLERLGIAWVVVDRSGEPDPERLWMRRRPGRFRRVTTVGVEELWRFRPAGSADAPR